MIIKEAELSDQKRLSEISRACMSDFWSEKNFADAVSNPNAAVFAAWSDDGTGSDIIGYAVLYFAADEGEIPSVAVLSQDRKQGIGTGILSAAVSFCMDHEIKSIFLEVRRSNQTAISFYQKNGFLQVGVRKDFYSDPAEDALLMKRNL